MVIVKGNFNAQQTNKPAQPVDMAEQMKADLGLDNIAIIHKGERNSAVIACFSEYQGRRNFQVKVVFMKNGKWCHGKGLTIDPSWAKEVCAHLGELSDKL